MGSQECHKWAFRDIIQSTGRQFLAKCPPDVPGYRADPVRKPRTAQPDPHQQSGHRYELLPQIVPASFFLFPDCSSQTPKATRRGPLLSWHRDFMAKINKKN